MTFSISLAHCDVKAVGMKVLEVWLTAGAEEVSAVLPTGVVVKVALVLPGLAAELVGWEGGSGDEDSLLDEAEWLAKVLFECVPLVLGLLIPVSWLSVPFFSDVPLELPVECLLVLLLRWDAKQWSAGVSRPLLLGKED